MKRYETFELSVVNLPECKICPLEPRTLVETEALILEPDILFIGNAPDYIDEYRGVFRGEKGQFIRSVIKEINKQADREITCAYTNLVLCVTPSERVPTETEIKCCNKRLWGEIAKINPKLIVLLGANALGTFFPGRKVSQCKNSIAVLDGYRFLSTYAPGYILANPIEFNPFVDAIVNNVFPPVPPKDWSKPRKWVEVTDCTDLFKSLESRGYDNPVSLDIETYTAYSTDPYRGAIHGVGIYDGEITHLIPFEVFKKYEHLWPKDTWVIVYDMTFEGPWFNHHLGIKLNMHDALIMHHLVDEKKSLSKSLKTAGAVYLQTHDWSIPIKKWLTSGQMHLAPKDIYNQYLSMDCEVNYDLFFILKDILEKENMLTSYNSIINPCSHFTNNMSTTGWRVDLEMLTDLEEEFTEKVADTKTKIIDIVGRSDFNPASNAHVLKFIKEEIKQHKAGDSVDKNAIMSYIASYEDSKDVPEFYYELLSFREDSKLLSTYIKGIYNLAGIDGRVHSRFYLVGTETGRLSSRDPNVQNIPKHGAYKKKIQNIFLPEDGYLLGETDYSQLELRIGAHLSQDDALISYLEKGDMHREMASLLFGVPFAQVSDEQRFIAKRGVFGIMYLMDEYGAVYNLRPHYPAMDRVLARKMINLMQTKFAKLYRYTIELQKEGFTAHEIRTLFGTARRFPLIASRAHEKQVARQIVNTPIQGTAGLATIIKGMDVNNLGFKVHNVIHDSIITSIKEAEDIYRVEEEMINMPFETNVPIKVESVVSDRWGGIPLLTSTRQK